MRRERVIEMATINAANALGLQDQIGSLEPGKGPTSPSSISTSLMSACCIDRSQALSMPAKAATRARFWWTAKSCIGTGYFRVWRTPATYLPIVSASGQPSSRRLDLAIAFSRPGACDDGLKYGMGALVDGISKTWTGYPRSGQRR